MVKESAAIEAKDEVSLPDAAAKLEESNLGSKNDQSLPPSLPPAPSSASLSSSTSAAAEKKPSKDAAYYPHYSDHPGLADELMFRPFSRPGFVGRPGFGNKVRNKKIEKNCPNFSWPSESNFQLHYIKFSKAIELLLKYALFVDDKEKRKLLHPYMR